MSIFDIVLMVLAIGMSVIALVTLGQKMRWWPFLFIACAVVSYVILSINWPSTATSTVVISSNSSMSSVVPIYIIILGYSIMLAIITMVCGSVYSYTTPGNSGRVGIVLVGFVFVCIVTMPLIYAWYRVFLVASAIVTLGILMGSTLGALWSMLSNKSTVQGRKYGSQTFSHILYYLSIVAIITTASNCDSVDDIFSLLTTSLLATSTATLGISIESGSWSAS